MATVILPLITFLGALLWVGIPRIILFLIPIVLSTSYLIFRSNYKVLILLVKEFKASICRKKNLNKSRQVWNILFKFIVVAFTSVYIVWGVQIFNTCLHEGMNGTDEAHYLVQAKIFYEDTNSWEIDHYEGKYAGTVFEDDHGPLWPVYLADAVLIERSFDINAIEIKYSYLVTVIAMIVMVINVGYIVTGSMWGGTLAIFLYFLYRYAIYFPLYGSRDGFRMVALLGFFVLLYELSIKAWNERNIPWEAGGWLFVLSYLALNGHTGNIFGMLGITIVFLILELFFELPFKQVIFSAVSILVGTMLCFMKSIMRYVEHGRFNALELEAYSDTVAAELFMENYAKRFEWKTIVDSYEWSDFFLILIGLVAILFWIVKCYKYYKGSNKNVKNGEKIYAFYLFMGLLSPMMGIYNFLGYNVPRLFLEQLRYRMYFLMILALLGGMMLSEIYFMNKKFLTGGICIIIIPVFYLGLINLNEYYPRVLNAQRQKKIESFKKITEIASSYATDGDIFAGEDIIAAYFDEPPKILYDYYARPILIANNDDEIEAAIDELNIQVFVFNTLAYRYHYYEVLPFYDYLQTSENVIYEHYDENGVDADIYIVNKKTAR